MREVAEDGDVVWRGKGGGGGPDEVVMEDFRLGEGVEDGEDQEKGEGGEAEDDEG